MKCAGLAVGFVLLLTVCVQPAHAQQRKDCNFEWPGLFRDYPRLREATLQTPTRNPDNWRGGWNYEYILDVARDTLRDFRRDEYLFNDFAKICVFTIGDGDGRIADGVAGIAPMWKVRKGTIHRRIYYNTSQSSDVVTMRLFLHELGHHIASYVDGTFSNDDFSVGRQHNMHVIQRMADFWAGAILYRLNEAERRRFTLERLLKRFGPRGYTDLYNSTPDIVETIRRGWLQSEYGDTPLWYYGVYDQPWIYQCPHQHPTVFASTDPNTPVIRI